MHSNSFVIILSLMAALSLKGKAVLALDKHEFHVVNDVKTDLDAIINDRLKADQLESPHVLSRKRRYLQFPEGSSFQFVYDLLVGVVDYTNYIVVAMTLALAWELPSKTPYEILEDVETRLRDGTYGITRNDTVGNITYVDTKPNYITSNTKPTNPAKPVYNMYYTNSKLSPVFIPPMHQQYYRPSEKDRFYKNKYSGYVLDPHNNNWRRKDNYYYSSKQNPFQKFSQNLQKLRYSPNNGNYPWWNLPSRLTNAIGNRPIVTSVKRYDQYPQSNYYQNPKYVRGSGRSLQSKHHIFPIFGKRSLPDIKGENNTRPLQRHRRSGVTKENLDKLDRIHIRHQRSTRHDLYNSIEKYLERKNLNGHYCVLRALCETGKKSQEREPGSFVGELMRAMFTMPEPLDEDIDKNRLGYREQRYDAAHTLQADCAAQYQQCEHSLWSSHFVA